MSFDWRIKVNDSIFRLGFGFGWGLLSIWIIDFVFELMKSVWAKVWVKVKGVYCLLGLGCGCGTFCSVFWIYLSIGWRGGL